MCVKKVANNKQFKQFVLFVSPSKTQLSSSDYVNLIFKLLDYQVLKRTRRQ